jgi:hypothetical protein
VTFQSNGGAPTHSLTNIAGAPELDVSSASTILTLGTANKTLHVAAGDDLSIQSGGTVSVAFGSNLAAYDLSASGLNGTLRIDGAGSLLTIGGNVANVIGGTGSGSLVLQNGSTGNTIHAALGIASSGAASTSGSLSVLSGSTLTLGGALTLAHQNIGGQAANLSIQGVNSALTQSGASAVTVGSAANGAATIAIGTTTSGGAFTTGTGLFTINKTGAVNIGGGTNTGTLNIGGDLTIDGGVLNKSSAASILDFADGKTITIQGGGKLTIAGPAVAEASQVFDVSGANSRIETTGTGPFSVRTGAHVRISAGATMIAAGPLQLASGAGTGSITVAGEASTLTVGNELSMWGSDGGAGTPGKRRKTKSNSGPGIRVEN